MRPNSTSIVIRSDLGSLVMEYLLNPASFVMGSILPVFKTLVKSGQYPIIPKEAFLKFPEKMDRAPRAAYSRDEIFFEMGNFETKDRGLEIPLDDEERKMYANLFSAEQTISLSIAAKMLRKHEKAGSDLLLDTGTFTNVAAGKKWNLKVDADPRTDVQARIKNIRDNTGVICDTVVMSETSFQDVLDCAAFIDQCKYTKTPQLSSRDEQIALVAAYFGVSKLKIVTEVYDSGKKQNSVTISDIWTNTKVMVCKTADNAEDLREPCVGRTMLWIGDSPDIITMEMYRDDKVRSDIYRGRANMAEKIVSADLGNLITGVR